ncbi:alpha/beta hydrolase [Kozakia baliensis]|uniref:alpha/beta hydrolase n=1 Tax=Kozakia baliensis TaxID=153496 RepID=UPI000691EE5E|nr:alpha/beta hydrolase [Kozakia baliensis]
MAAQEDEARVDYSTARLSQRYRFNDSNMDLFFLGALGWGPAGGLSAGEAYYVASQIEDGNPKSWADAFERQGRVLAVQADTWLERGSRRAAGEARLKGFACYRSAWQFVPPGERFASLFRTSQKLFDQAMKELRLRATSFTVPYKGGALAGHFYQAADPSAPTVMVIGGADTCHEDRFLSQGRYYLERGYSVALVDLLGQGLTMEDGLHWEPEIERPLGAVIDELVVRFDVKTEKLAMLGMSLGGYFACRAAAEEPRLGAVIATPALPRPHDLFAAAAKASEDAGASTSEVERRNMQVLLWKAGVDDLASLSQKWAGVSADPSKVHVPFLSVLGGQEGEVWKKATTEWHQAIPSKLKRFVTFDAPTGADAHCQGSNPLILAQEVDTWLRHVL